MITGKTLQDWGLAPGRWLTEGIEKANRLRSEGAPDPAIFATLRAMAAEELEMRTNGEPFTVLIDPQSDAERANLESVIAHMSALMRVPTVRAGAVMPNAYPSGQAIGTLPIGGTVACEDAIHPGFQSDDICCSVAVTVFGRNADPKLLLDAVEATTHFGANGRPRALRTEALSDLVGRMSGNPFLEDLEGIALDHFGSQGDGDHFAYVGHLASTGQLALVTHQGSRGLGAQIQKRGLAAARRHTARIAPRAPSHSAWLKADSREGEQYWEALQFVRLWTRANHYALHDLAAAATETSISDRFWNEHKFIFRRSDGLFYHGNGATPSWKGFSSDDDGRTLIPLNMSEPILITAHRQNPKTLGFAPHSAGRNASRAQKPREGEAEHLSELAALRSNGVDLRWFSGVHDPSELPSTYKPASALRKQIEQYDLADIIDEILPYGAIMAGGAARKSPPPKVARARAVRSAA